MSRDEVQIGRSAEGACLRLFEPDRGADQAVESFRVELGDASASAQLRVHASAAGELALLFESMVREEDRWSGTKSWCSPGREFELRATRDGRGYLNFVIHLAAPTWRFECTVPLPASQLARVAAEIRAFVDGAGHEA